MEESSTTRMLKDRAARMEAGTQEIPDQTPDLDEDAQDDGRGDGRWNRHQVFAVQLVQENRNAVAVTYASIQSPITFNPSKGIMFAFEGKDGLQEVTISGNNLEGIYDRLTAGKRETIRVNGSNVQAITLTSVAKD